MREAMAARGPHGAGLWLSHDRTIGLAHRRLAVIDPDPRAGQPMASPCGRWQLVYNGELYNWRELAAELLAAGVRLRTRSDTEGLLHWFARHGVDGLRRLRGMYAFALWDGAERRLWLGRDPFGIKPLYWHADGRTVRVASQVQALLAGKSLDAAPEPAGIMGFLLWGAVPEPWTTVAGIRALPAGHVLMIGPDGPGTPRPFLTVADVLREGAASAVPAADEVAAAFVDSVRAHLEADLPAGLFLSAGIDSSALLAALARLGRTGDTLAVTLGFAKHTGRPEDEVPLATSTAVRYGVRQVVRRVDAEEFKADLPRFLAAMDQPTIDGLNSWFIAKAAREQGLHVALSGLGGDELFGGYPSFVRVPRLVRTRRWARGLPLAAVWRAVIELLMRLGAPLHPKLAGLFDHATDTFGAWRLVRGLFLPHEPARFLDRDFVATGLARLTEDAQAAQLIASVPDEPFTQIALLEATLYMRNQLLRDTDWAAMADSVEVGVPFVDLALWRIAHARARSHPGESELGRALGLPEPFLRGPKTGFTTPIARWLDALAPSEHRHGPWARRWACWLLPQTCLPGGGLSLPPKTALPAAPVGARRACVRH